MTKLGFESPLKVDIFKKKRKIVWVSDSRNFCQVNCGLFNNWEVASASYVLRVRFVAVEHAAKTAY